MGEAVEALVVTQWGVFSRAQALAAGISASGILRRLHSGAWLQFDTHVFRFPGPEATWHMKVMAATLALGPRAMASHRSAAFLWNLDARGGEPSPLEALAPKSSGQRTTWARVHRSRRLPAPVIRDAIPVTPLARTLVDLSHVLKEPDLFRALDAARRQDAGIVAAVLKELDETRMGQRRGPQRLAALVAQVKDHRPTDSPLEADAARLLLATKLPQPKRQHSICDREGKFIARVDFAWPEHRVVLMCDGRTWHANTPAWEKDIAQRRRLEAHGWRVLAITRRTLATGEPWIAELTHLLEAQGILLCANL